MQRLYYQNPSQSSQWNSRNSLIN